MKIYPRKIRIAWLILSVYSFVKRTISQRLILTIQMQITPNNGTNKSVRLLYKSANSNFALSHWLYIDPPPKKKEKECVMCHLYNRELRPHYSKLLEHSPLIWSIENCQCTLGLRASILLSTVFS